MKIMRKKIIYFAILLLIFSSCSKEDLKYSDISESSSGNIYIPDPIIIPSKSLDWDESYHPNDMISKGQNQSSEMAITSVNLFIGGVYTAASINDLTISPINKPVKSISVAYTFPGFFTDIIPTPGVVSMYTSLGKAVESPKFSGQQSLSFEYDFRQFSYYNEMKLAFGGNVNIFNILKIDATYENGKIKQKTGLFARVLQKNFSVIMDYPTNGNIFKNESDLAATSHLSPVYINSVTFGRMAIISIESESNYEEVKKAFKLALTVKTVGGELQLDDTSRELLEKAEIRILVYGGAGSEVAKLVMGFDKFQEFIVNGGEFSKEVPGVPIFFTCNYASDNSIFSTTFTTN